MKAKEIAVPIPEGETLDALIAFLDAYLAALHEKQRREADAQRPRGR